MDKSKREPCLLCGGHDFVIVVKKHQQGIPISVVRCKSCGLFATNPAIPADDINTFIFEGYYKSKDIGSRIDSRFIRHFSRRARTHWNIIKKFFPGGFTGRALDIGCGAGFFLNEIKKAGWEAKGIEPDGACAEYGRTQLHLDIYRGLFDGHFPENKFDLVYLSHVLDDLPSLNEALQRIRSMLSPGGLFFVEVPNIEADESFSQVKPGDYLENKVYFSRETLVRLLEKNGFSPLLVELKEPVYLNSWRQCLLSPFTAMKKIKLPRRKNIIRVVARVS